MKGGRPRANRLSSFLLRQRQARGLFKSVRPHGYTVIEVMIVLAVTGALFVSAAVIINGRQQRTQFEQAIREVHSQIQQVMSETRNGFYPSNGNFNCTVTGGGPPQFSAVASGQGTNEGCVFLGKAIQFDVDSTDPEEFRVMTIAGRQQNDDGQPVGNLDEAQPRAVAPAGGSGGSGGGGGGGGSGGGGGGGGSGGGGGGGCPWWWPPCWFSSTVSAQATPDASINEQLLYGLSTAWSDTGVVAFVSSLSEVEDPDASRIGQLNVIPVDDTSIDMTEEAAAQAVNDNLASSPLNPDDGVQICFVSGGTSQSGLVTIGATGRGLGVTLDIRSNRDCS